MFRSKLSLRSIRWLGFSLSLHLLAAWFSIGFYDVDEHFQILEFMNYHLGFAGSDHQVWEFYAQMRPWLQPLLYEAVVRVGLGLGMQNPFQQAMACRMVSAILGWLSIVGLALCCSTWFKDLRWRERAVGALSLFWCLPYFHARTSCENLSSTFFCFALSTYVLGGGKKYLLWMGFLLGLSFDLRYQMAIAIAAFLGWLWLVDKRRILFFFRPLLGCILAIFLGLLADRWGYHTWVLTPWNYFYQNIILAKASQMGVSPFWYYFVDLFNVFPPLGWVMTILSICAWVLCPFHILSVVSFGFVVIHSFLAHKEPRFLFPLIPFAPLLLILGAQSLQELIHKKFSWRPSRYFSVVGRGLILCLLIVHSGALAISTLKPSSSQPNFYQSVYSQKPEIDTLYYVGSNPYWLGGAEVKFYRRPSLKLAELSDLSTFAKSESNREFWVFNGLMTLSSELSSGLHCQLKYTVYPQWLDYFKLLAGPRRFASRWSLFLCKMAP